ncbi:hypothetical protein ACZ98_23600 (plasmid) [Vibrio parahaemolyticus]|nr:hypothetical protein ACZ98_23600 [Vibrio parahaemolyticus]
MTTPRRHANGDGRHKVTVLSARFQGNTANNLTQQQFADFHDDAQRLADDIDSEFNLTGKNADGKRFKLRVKPKFRKVGVSPRPKIDTP